MNVPRHVAVIPDGNRRFAKRLMKEPSMGHEWGAGKIRKMLDWCKDLGIKVVTVYTLSLENLHKRPKEELDFIMELAKKELADIIKEGGLAHENRIRITAFGRLDLLPKDVQASFKKAEEQTKGYNDYFLNIAMAYGGRQELVEASRDIAFRISQGKLTPEDIDEMVLRQSLQTNGNADPDLVIRTGGEKRLSNFLVFQAAYSELAFTDTFWPELGEKEFYSIIEEYSNRQRRFGK